MVKPPRFFRNPEKRIENRVREYHGQRGWLVEKTHSSALVSGWPDLFMFRQDKGIFWVDIKNPEGYRYTPSQCRLWTHWASRGLGVWIMTEEDETVLDRPPNFMDFWKPHYEKYLDGTIMEGVLLGGEEDSEGFLEKELVETLRSWDWLVFKTHSTTYSKGWPDLMLYHTQWGFYWVDVKRPNKNRLTKAQCQTWTRWEKHGLGVWILEGIDDLSKLKSAPNWREYWRPDYDKYIKPVDLEPLK